MSSLVLLAALSSGCSHHGGSSSVSAANQEYDQGIDAVSFGDEAAWFTGTKKIKYCIYPIDGSKIYQQDADLNAFGASVDQVQKALEAAVQTWVDYAANNHVKPNVAMTLDTMETSCDSHQDLTIFLGEVHTSNASWVTATSRLSVAVRTYYDPVLNWGQGFIFLANPGTPLTDGDPNSKAVVPPWTDSTLQAVLTHELGHIFGVTHAPDTVMDENINALVLEPSTQETRVDGFHDLLFAPSVKSSLEGTDAAANFKLLTGHDASGAVSATITTTAAAPSSTPTYSLILTDSTPVTHTFVLEAVTPAPGPNLIAPVSTTAPTPNPAPTPTPVATAPIAIFATATSENGNIVTTSNIVPPPLSTDFNLKTESGQVLSVTLTRNIDTTLTNAAPNNQASGLVLTTGSATSPSVIFAEHVRVAPVAPTPSPTPTNP